MPAIVRVLWGADVPSGRWKKVVGHDMTPQVVRGQRCVQHVYVYGEDNVQLLERDKNLVIHLLDKSPFPDGKSDIVTPQNILRPWHYKHQMLKQAVNEHGKIIYCDWDVSCYVTDKAEAFDALKGREYAFSAFLYKRPRFQYRDGRYAQRFTASGNWLYFDGPEFIDTILEAMSTDDPWAWHDELVIGRLIDKMYGGIWPGDEEWLKTYESPIMCQRRHRSPWAALSDDGKTVVKQTPIPFTWTRMFGQNARPC